MKNSREIIKKTLSENSEFGLNITEIAKFSKLSKDTVIHWLGRMEMDNEVFVRVVGTSKIYKLKQNVQEQHISD